MSMPMTSVRRAALTLSAAAALLIVAGWATGEWLDAIAAPGPAAVWDHRIFAWAVGQQSPWLNVIMEAVTWLGSPVLRIAIAVTAAVYLFRRNGDRRWPAFMLTNTIGVMLIYRVVKFLVTRPRPDVDALVVALGHSWPSGHAAGGAALYLSLAYAAAASRPRSANGRVVWFGAAMTAAMIGASRVYLGVHWPSDVLAGLVMGTAWFAISASVCSHDVDTRKFGTHSSEKPMVSLEPGADEANAQDGGRTIRNGRKPGKMDLRSPELADSWRYTRRTWSAVPLPGLRAES